MAFLRYIRGLQLSFRMYHFTVKSFSHNTCRRKGYIIDGAFEPLFWFIDQFTRGIGVAFVILVTLLTASVVIIWYVSLRPIIQSYSPPWIIAHFVYAHWLLINIVFHYFKAVFTDPGLPPQGLPLEDIKGSVVCRKCIQPKPLRTHHCSVCGRCILKMDHHCPWMNNCIGHYNHRYFICFCIYMWLGTVYVSLTSWDLFTYHFFHPGSLLDQEKRHTSLAFAFGFGPLLSQVLNIVSEANGTGLARKTVYRPHPGGDEQSSSYEHVCVIYLFLLCSAVTIALGLLNTWHAYLVTRGETSIEVHINGSEKTKAAQKGLGYNNPYDYGWKQNWKYLLGITSQRSFIWILLPSGHVPTGDGLSWPINKKPIFYSDPEAVVTQQKKKNSCFSKVRRLCHC